MPSETTTGAPRSAARPPVAHAAGPLGHALGADDVVLTGGLLGQWQRRNADATLPHAIDRVRASGVLDNFRRVAHSTGEPFSGSYPFADTDAYKTLEAAAYELARAETAVETAIDTSIDTVTGHAVRMVYLAAGATDVAVERGDTARLDHLLRLWDDMVRTKSYVTGGIGSRHSDEAFGDRYELPSERAYAETCAAIGTMQWGWRLFLATGSAAVLDHVERVLYNGFAAGIGLDGTRFFYDNPLQRRPDHTDGRPADPADPLRRAWFGCACCPPNATRWVSQLQDHVALAAPDGLTIALPAAGRMRSDALSVEVVTDYPWDGHITVRVLDARAAPATLTVRVPGWATAPRVTVDGSPVAAEAPDGWLRLTRAWRPGQEVVLDLPMHARLVTSHPAVDATRGAVAAVRGPVVHCLEQADSPAPVDDVVVHAVGDPTPSDTPLDPVLRHALTAHVSRRPAPSDDPYPAADRTDPDPTDPPASSTTTQVTLVPYHLWANREPGAMRVWLRHT